MSATPTTAAPAATPRRKSRRRLGALAATAVAGLALAVVPGIANAQSLQSVAVATDSSDDFLVLDVSGGSTAPGAGVIQWYGHGGANQRWNFVEQADGSETIVNQNSGQCLTTDGVAGHQLFQWPCNGGGRQEWRGTLLPELGAGFTTGKALTNVETGLRVDIEGASRWAGARAVGWYDNGGANQYFTYYQLG